MKIGKFLKDKRIKENKTQIEMCKSIGICKVTLVKLENIKFYRPSFKIITKLANYFNVSTDEIIRML